MFLSEALSTPITLSIPLPPLHIGYVYTCIRTVYLFTGMAGEGGRDEPERRLEGASWVENSNMSDCISSLWTLINICRKVPSQVNFLDDDI